MPFKKCQNHIASNNKRLASTRLKSLVKRLRSNTELFESYSDIFKQQLQEGIIEEVTDSTAPGEGEYFMPHHPVQRPDKATTKLRIVFDASSKMRAKSLNDVLHSGPNLFTPLFDILIRFRQNRIALVADIKQAFLQVKIDEKHRDFLRFIWIKDLQADTETIYRFARVVFGVSASPFLLNATIKYHLGKFEGDIAKKVSNSLYVDDLTSGAKNDDKTIFLYKESKRILAEGGFELRKWESNSAVVMNEINSCEPPERDEIGNKIVEETQSYADTVSNKRTLVAEYESKVLGIVWDKKSDDFVFRFDDIAKDANKNKCTKRNLLSIIVSIYDPIGF